jgi:hypothetical protein
VDNSKRTHVCVVRNGLVEQTVARRAFLFFWGEGQGCCFFTSSLPWKEFFFTPEYLHCAQVEQYSLPERYFYKKSSLLLEQM